MKRETKHEAAREWVRSHIGPRQDPEVTHEEACAIFTLKALDTIAAQRVKNRALRKELKTLAQQHCESPSWCSHSASKCTVCRRLAAALKRIKKGKS